MKYYDTDILDLATSSAVQYLAKEESGGTYSRMRRPTRKLLPADGFSALVILAELGKKTSFEYSVSAQLDQPIPFTLFAF